MNELKDFLQFLGFKPKEGQSNYWHKQYKSFSDYEISVVIQSNQDVVIDFGKLIQVERKTTSSLNTAENYVILECVNRLIEKGYRPQSIILEKKWKLGHEGKGFLDIQVLDGLGESFLMIECKTWGKEFSKAEEETLKNGGQLFSYLQQEPNTKYICLYTSKFENGVVQYRSNIIENTEEFKNKNQSQMFDIWDKVFEEKGIFEENASSYNIKFTELLKSDLKTLEQVDGGKIFNLFAEILRRNVVSDKNNAFNKIFNLFLCKIVDEDKKRDGDEMAFQWKKQYDKLNLAEENAGYKEFLGALNDLYKEGIKDYLQIEVTDHSKDEVETLLQMLPTASVEAKSRIKTIIEELRFYKSNEFAFKEVNNKESFEENSKIVKEMVELLQGYKLKYSAKHQFLGDFFENLLNTGIKQESGQFFTPTPIASFICKSLPIWSIIENKNNQEEVKFLPHVIDFASGSGHFLTESMDEINYYVEKKINDNWIKGGKRAKDEFEAGKRSYKWAKEYVYGIEKDYRLAKTTKISAFLNGDGDANVICGDGLGSFKHDKKYIGLLKSDNDSKDNQKFDILVANPPYSVDEFKVTIENHGKDSFELFSGLSDQASEIECLFIERTKQLLKDGGVAGIILPISILSNGKIHMRARELILKYFEIKAIVEFGANTFMATGTKTATLFLRRRNNNEWRIIQSKVDEFFDNLRDVTVNGIESIFSKYVEHVYGNINLKDYVSLFTNEASEEILNHEIIKDYKSVFKKLAGSKLTEAIKDVEKEKLLYFILTYNQRYVLVKAPSDNNTEKEFLGYEFSNRRGHEGIKIYKDENGQNITKLFNSDYEALYDETKVNSYILRAFENIEIPEPIEELNKVLQIQSLHESLDFERVNFEKRISTELSKKKIDFKNTWNSSHLINLGEIAELQKGTSITKEKTSEGNVPVIAGGKVPAYFHNVANREANIITVSASGANAGFVNYFETRIFASDCTTIKSKDEYKISTKLIYYFLQSIQEEIYALQRGQAQPHVYSSDLINIKIPLPPLHIQEKILREIADIEVKEMKIKEEIEDTQIEMEKLIENVNASKVKIEDICEVKGGKRVPKGYKFERTKTNYPYIRVLNFKNNTVDTTDIVYISESVYEKIKNYTISKDDIYISIAGTVGLVGIIPAELDGKSLTENAARLVLNKLHVNQFYLMNILKSSYSREQIKLRTKALGVPKLALDRIKTIQVPLPPLSEQGKIAKQIQQIEVRQTELRKELAQFIQTKSVTLNEYH